MENKNNSIYKVNFSYEDLIIYDRLEYGKEYYNKSISKGVTSYEVVKEELESERLREWVKAQGLQVEECSILTTDGVLYDLILGDLSKDGIDGYRWYNEEHDTMYECGYKVEFGKELVSNYSYEKVKSVIYEGSGSLIGLEESEEIYNEIIDNVGKKNITKDMVMMFILGTDMGIQYMCEMDMETKVCAILGMYK